MIAIDPSFRQALITYGIVLLLGGVAALLGIFFLALHAKEYLHPNRAEVCGRSTVGCPSCKTSELLHAKPRA